MQKSTDDRSNEKHPEDGEDADKVPSVDETYEWLDNLLKAHHARRDDRLCAHTGWRVSDGQYRCGERLWR